jgi:hypothetical protein
MPTPAGSAARRNRLTTRLKERDDFGLVLVLILATILTISLGGGAPGQFIGVCLSGFTLLFVLHTSGARRRTFRAALRSRSIESPQWGQSCRRSLRSFGTLMPQPEHSWLVFLGSTSIRRAPALSALYRSIEMNLAHEASWTSLAKALLARPFTLSFSTTMTS